MLTVEIEFDFASNTDARMTTPIKEDRTRLGERLCLPSTRNEY